MNLTIKTPSDLIAYFEQTPAPVWGKRDTFLDDVETVERVIHASELSLDNLMELPHYEAEENDNFDLDNFLTYH